MTTEKNQAEITAEEQATAEKMRVGGVWRRLANKSAMKSALVAHLQAVNTRMKDALVEIRDVANCSEGVEFYGILASKGLEEPRECEDSVRKWIKDDVDTFTNLRTELARVKTEADRFRRALVEIMVDTATDPYERAGRALDE